MSGQPRSIRDYRPKPDIIGIEGITDLTDVYRWLKKGQLANDSYAKKFELNPPYKTLVVDGWSEAQRWVALGAAGNTGKEAGERFMAVEIQAYGVILAQSLGIFEGFYKLPMHVIGTVLESEKENERTKRMYYRHLLVGQAREQLSSYAEIVGRLVHVGRLTQNMQEALKEEITEETSHIAIFKPSLYIEAKDQTHALGDVMVDPTIGKMLDLIEEHDVSD
jgi:hypothetical protein